MRAGGGLGVLELWGLALGWGGCACVLAPVLLLRASAGGGSRQWFSRGVQVPAVVRRHGTSAWRLHPGECGEGWGWRWGDNGGAVAWH